MKEILARYLWIILCLCLGCDIVDYDRAAAMRDDMLKEIINEGFCYIEGKHNLDIGLVRCSFWLSEDKTMMQLIDIVRNNGWWEVSQIKLKGRKYYGENWDFAFRRGDEMLLIRNGVTKVDILIRHKELYIFGVSPRQCGQALGFMENRGVHTKTMLKNRIV